LLLGEWGWHADFFYAGNRPLTDAETDRLAKPVLES
jgi:hypothetical protein